MKIGRHINRGMVLNRRLPEGLPRAFVDAFANEPQGAMRQALPGVEIGGFSFALDEVGLLLQCLIGVGSPRRDGMGAALAQMFPNGVSRDCPQPTPERGSRLIW